jgi:hypothetical protein
MLEAMETFKPYKPYEQESPLRKWWNSRTFLQKRMIRFSLSMLVLVICIPFYHLGLFGTVEGPLNPSNLGDSLATMGVTKTHSMLFFLSFLIIAGTWNLIFNLISYLMGARLTCNRTDDSGKPCGAKTERRKVVHKKTGQSVAQYVCTEGHKRPDAHFHPVQKGTFSKTVFMMALAFCVIVFFLS